MSALWSRWSGPGSADRPRESVSTVAEPRRTLQNGVPIVSQTRARDKAELRAAMQESAFQHTTLLRERLLPGLRQAHPDKSEEELASLLDEVQPIYAEYDPVVAMSMIAVDHSNPVDLRMKAHAEVAQYVRPKLKSVEMTIDPQSEEEKAARKELAGRIVSLLEVAAQAKQGMVIEGEARRPYDPAPVDDTDD